MPIVRLSFPAVLLAAAAVLAGLGGGRPAAAAPITAFTAGDLVISTVSCSVSSAACSSTSGGLDTAAPIVLNEFSLSSGGTSATPVGTLALPQTGSGANSAISGEYGSASEGILQQSVNGKYLTIMGYGVNANNFNTGSTYGTNALGQTVSIPTGSLTVVPRVVALIGNNTSVDTSTALTGVFNTNNPRSAATVNGSSFYVSGQGVTGDGTGGVFYALDGATTATPINGNTTIPSGSPNGTANPLLATETRAVEIVNNGSGNTLYVSRDFAAKGSPNDATDIRSFTNASGGLPTSASGLVADRVIADVNSTGGNTGSIDVTNATDNIVNHSRNGQAPGHTGNTFVYLSPEQYFFPNASTLYVADSGSPKNGSATAAGLGDGGLQKWVNSMPDGSGTWTEVYDMFNGLSLTGQANADSATPQAPGITGLFGLTGDVVGSDVELFATTYGLNELSQSYLYEITDLLSNTNYVTGQAEMFNLLYTAPADTVIRGVAFAPVPEPGSLTILAAALAGLGLLRRRSARS